MGGWGAAFEGRRWWDSQRDDRRAGVTSIPPIVNVHLATAVGAVCLRLSVEVRADANMLPQLFLEPGRDGMYARAAEVMRLK